MRIYLDNNATTALDPEVVHVCLEEMQKGAANPSSVHQFGQEAKNRLARARRQAATLLGVTPGEIIFNSGGTEGINTVLKGLFPGHAGHIISSEAEHKATLHVLEWLQKHRGWEVSLLPPEEKGYISSAQIQAALRPNTKIVTLMAVNNETGVKTPDLEQIAEMVDAHGAKMVIDAVAAVGKSDFSIPQAAHAVTFSAHKFHGPKGAGILYLKKGCFADSLLHGGGQEYQRRAGTENLVGILGMVKALELTAEKEDLSIEKMTTLRNHFESRLMHELGGIHINGHRSLRAANTSNISFEGVEGESLLMNLDLAGICASHGSACSSGALEPSHVLQAMQLPPSQTQSSVRFSLSRMTEEQEVNRAVDQLIEIVQRLRSFVC